MAQYCPFGGKKRYKSEKEAKHVRNAIGKSHNVQELRIYQCPNCHDWHFTSNLRRGGEVF